MGNFLYSLGTGYKVKESMLEMTTVLERKRNEWKETQKEYKEIQNDYRETQQLQGNVETQ